MNRHTPDAESWMRTLLDQALPGLSDERRGEYDALVAALAEAQGAAFWGELPAQVHAVFGPRGWAWNGIYALSGERLELVAAAGPPVCQTLERQGGVGTSGMCFDALLMNQTIVAREAHAWPGYVSCDGESGLATAAGLVCPIRGADGRPIAVWDLDSTQPLADEDPFFFDRFFATASVVLEPSPSDLVG